MRGFGCWRSSSCGRPGPWSSPLGIRPSPSERRGRLAFPRVSAPANPQDLSPSPVRGEAPLSASPPTLGATALARGQLGPARLADVGEGRPTYRAREGVFLHRRSAFRAQGLPAGGAGVGPLGELRPARGTAAGEIQAALRAAEGRFGDGGSAARARKAQIRAAGGTGGNADGDHGLARRADPAGLGAASGAGDLLRPEPGPASGAEALPAPRARPLRRPEDGSAVRARRDGRKGRPDRARGVLYERWNGDRGRAMRTCGWGSEEGALAGRAAPDETPAAIGAFRSGAQEDRPTVRACEGEGEPAPSASGLGGERLLRGQLPTHRTPDRAACGTYAHFLFHRLAASGADGFPDRRAA